MVDFNQVIDYYRVMASDEINYREFIVAFLIRERGYMIDSPEDIKPEEVQKLAKIVEGYDSIINDNLGEDIDDLINYPREHDSLYDD